MNTKLIERVTEYVNALELPLSETGRGYMSLIKFPDEDTPVEDARAFDVLVYLGTADGDEVCRIWCPAESAMAEELGCSPDNALRQGLAYAGARGAKGKKIRGMYRFPDMGVREGVANTERESFIATVMATWGTTREQALAGWMKMRADAKTAKAAKAAAKAAAKSAAC